MTPLVIGLLAYGHVARVVRPLNIPAFLQQAGWVALVVAVAIVALRLSGPRLQRAGTALTRVAALLIVVTLVLIVPFQVMGATAGAGTDEDGRDGDVDDGAEAGCLLVHLRPVRLRPRAWTCCTGSRTT